MKQNDANCKDDLLGKPPNTRSSKIICVSETANESNNEIESQSTFSLSNMKRKPCEVVLEKDNNATIFMTEISSKRRKK